MKLGGVLLLAFLLPLMAQPKRVLYVTHSAGFRHGSIETSRRVLQQLAERSGRYTVTATEDLSLLQPENLSSFDAVFFFTSGELPLSDRQKAGLLDFVRSGKGFGGVHSATDTLYQWPAYGELIGGYFDGHPWTQRVRVDVEDAAHALTSHLAPSFELLEEIYQFRAFSRQNLRVLLTLDIASVNLAADGVNRKDEDFALAWVRPYGRGRVFYSAFGHFDETWLDERFQLTLDRALEWLTGLREAPDAPRAATVPAIADRGIGNAANLEPRDVISAGSLVSIYGSNLTEGPAMPGDGTRLAGTVVRVNNQRARLLYTSPGQINLVLPPSVSSLPCILFPGGGVCRPSAQLSVTTASGTTVERRVELAEATPAIFTTTVGPGYVTLWMTGLGATERIGSLDRTAALPEVSLGGTAATVLYSGLAPGWPGLYQVNVAIPPSVTGAAEIRFRIHGATTSGQVTLP